MKLCVVSGRCGVGKDTVIDELVKNYGFFRAKSCTTRQRRNDEKDHYYFLTENIFFRLKDRGRLLDCIELNGFYYGFPIGQLIQKRGLFVANLISESAFKLKHMDSNTILFHLVEKEEEIKKRLTLRDGEEKAIMKIATDPNDFQRREFQDFEIINSDSKTTAYKIAEIMKGGSI